jgi:hypothetical protein
MNRPPEPELDPLDYAESILWTMDVAQSGNVRAAAIAIFSRWDDLAPLRELWLQQQGLSGGGGAEERVGAEIVRRPNEGTVPTAESSPIVERRADVPVGPPPDSSPIEEIDAALRLLAAGIRNADDWETARKYMRGVEQMLSRARRRCIQSEAGIAEGRESHTIALQGAELSAHASAAGVEPGPASGSSPCPACLGSRRIFVAELSPGGSMRFGYENCRRCAHP